ncbi:MAG: hypothetical protein F6K11_34845, partial [Leptolyngbya sp. SIO3F4]|nr:hypothetical protein [Leptolyngbya sp. SIO3F4]
SLTGGSGQDTFVFKGKDLYYETVTRANGSQREVLRSSTTDIITDFSVTDGDMIQIDQDAYQVWSMANFFTIGTSDGSGDVLLYHGSTSIAVFEGGIEGSYSNISELIMLV